MSFVRWIIADDIMRLMFRAWCRSKCNHILGVGTCFKNNDFTNFTIHELASPVGHCDITDATGSWITCRIWDSADMKNLKLRNSNADLDYLAYAERMKFFLLYSSYAEKRQSSLVVASFNCIVKMIRLANWKT